MTFGAAQPVAITTAQPGWRVVRPTADGWDVVHVVAWAVMEHVREGDGEIHGAEPGWRPTSVEPVFVDPELGPMAMEPPGATHWLAPGDALPPDEWCADEWAERQAAQRRRVAQLEQRARPPISARRTA